MILMIFFMILMISFSQVGKRLAAKPHLHRRMMICMMIIMILSLNDDYFYECYDGFAGEDEEQVRIFHYNIIWMASMLR